MPPKIISQLPLNKLWADSRLVSTIKVRDLDDGDIVELLRLGPVRFVVANVGEPLEWISNNERYEFWKHEVRPHLASPEQRVSLEDFPDNYCYFASEWKTYEGDNIVLLSKAH